VGLLVTCERVHHLTSGDLPATSRHHDWKRAILRHHHALTVFL